MVFSKNWKSIGIHCWTSINESGPFLWSPSFGLLSLGPFLWAPWGSLWAPWGPGPRLHCPYERPISRALIAASTWQKESKLILGFLVSFFLSPPHPTHPPHKSTKIRVSLNGWFWVLSKYWKLIRVEWAGFRIILSWETSEKTNQTKLIFPICSTSNSSPILPLSARTHRYHFWKIPKRHAPTIDRYSSDKKKQMVPHGAIWWNIRCQLLTRRTHNHDPHQVSPIVLFFLAAHEILGMRKWFWEPIQNRCSVGGIFDQQISKQMIQNGANLVHDGIRIDQTMPDNFKMGMGGGEKKNIEKAFKQ